MVSEEIKIRAFVLYDLNRETWRQGWLGSFVGMTAGMTLLANDRAKMVQEIQSW